MTQKVTPYIELGPGGSIPDTEGNQDLLKRIQYASPLEPLQLFVLANFLHPYQANTFLADHLTLIGETKLFLSLVDFDFGDWWEDLGGFDNTQEEKDEKLLLIQKRSKVGLNLNVNLNFLVSRGKTPKEQTGSEYPLPYADYDIKCISLIPGLDLLIETYKGADPHIIGVCPELGSPS
ncbi:MAG: hypothetical protein ACJ797_06110 [Ktedonobacteraceae bacterium]